MMLFDDFVPDPEEHRPLRGVKRKDLLTPAQSEFRADPTPSDGGLIRIVTPLSPRTRGVLLTLRGETAKAEMILKTDTMREMQCYRAELSVQPEWKTINLLWSDFRPVGGVLRRLPRAEVIRSYAVRSQRTDEPLLINRVRFY